MHGNFRRTSQNLVSLFRSAAPLAFRRTKTSAAKRKQRAASGQSPSSVAAPKKQQSSTSVAAPKKQPSTSAAATKKKTSTSPEDAALKEYLSSVKSSSTSAAAYERAKREKSKRLLRNFKSPPSSSTDSDPAGSSLNSIVCSSLNSDRGDDDEKSAKQLAAEVSSLLYDEMDLDWDDDEGYHQELLAVEDVLVLPWLERLSNTGISVMRKEVTQDRKQKWVFKSSLSSRYKRLVNMCATKLGPDLAVELFGRLGRENGLKEFNALIKICIDKARETTDEEVSLQQIFKAYQLLKLVREYGFQLEEETYGPFLMYLIDFGMSEEFFFFHELIREDNPESLSRLIYYEMLLWLRVENDEKIRELCVSAAKEYDNGRCYRQEALLQALCESNRKEEFLMILETLDISKVTSVAVSEYIFRGLGRFLLEPSAERFLLVLKESDIGAENISNLILEYTISIPNLVVEVIVKKFQALHSKFNVVPTSAQYEKLIRYCCGFLKVHEALNVLDDAFESGIALSLEAFHSVLDACDRSCEFNLVHQIYSRITHHNLEPNNETFRRMILQCVKMKDFEGAYKLIDDCKKSSEPTTSMYNVILAGYFREKNIRGALNVLKQMEDAGMKPDAMTYSYLIANSQLEEDITKHYEDMIGLGISPTKQVFMALINAYASFGNFEGAKKIINSKRIPGKYMEEIKNVLVGALASNGQLTDALEMYEEMKGAKCYLDPKAIKSLIEHFQSDGQLSKSLQLLEELNDSPYWTDACFRVISHCVRHENLRTTVDLLKQIKAKFIDAEVALEVLFDEVFCMYAEGEPTDMQFGLDLLEAIKTEVGVRPSRKSLDFLLSACTNAQDANTSFLIWKEYERAGLPYNVLSFVRMYQALLASGDQKSAAKLLSKIPKDDGHVRCVLRACHQKYVKGESVKTRKKKALLATLGVLESLEAKTE